MACPLNLMFATAPLVAMCSSRVQVLMGESAHLRVRRWFNLKGARDIKKNTASGVGTGQEYFTSNMLYSPFDCGLQSTGAFGVSSREREREKIAAVRVHDMSIPAGI